MFTFWILLLLKVRWLLFNPFCTFCTELPPRDYENVSILSGNNNNNNNDKKVVDAMLEEEGGNDCVAKDAEPIKRTFATIYPVSSKPEVYIFDKPEVGEVALKDGFVFQRSEAVASAEGKNHASPFAPI